MPVPTEPRVESRSPGSNTLYWFYAGVIDVDIYRNAVLLDTVPGLGLTFVDDTAQPGVSYSYTLTDDGVIFTTPVTVTTQLLDNATKSLQSTNTPQLPQFAEPRDITPENLNQISQQVEATLGLYLIEGPGSPCEICITNGAIVADCGSGCNSFVVKVTEDINSVSIIGCTSCPSIDFVVADGTTRGVCGVPAGCHWSGDECFRVPIYGPRVVNIDGTSREDINEKNMVPPDPCECTLSSVDVTIKCCEADNNCIIDCTKKAVTLKACGGYGPYTWSKTGNVRLSSTTQQKIRVISTFKGNAGVPGLFPGQIATFIPIVCNYYSECGSCGAGGTNVEIAGGIDIRGYGCDGNFLLLTLPTGGTFPLGPAPYSNQNWTIDVVNVVSCSGGSQNLSFQPGGSAVFLSRCCNPDGKVNWTYDVATAGINCSSGIVWSGAEPFSGILTGAEPNSVCNNPNECTEVPWDNPAAAIIDVRTQAMVDAGCAGCSPGPISVTARDSFGRGATIFLHL